MTKTISKVGNSQGIIFDAALMDLARVKVGDQLGLLLLDADDSLSLRGEVVHHGTVDTFGVEFQELSTNQQKAVEEMIARLHSRL